ICSENVSGELTRSARGWLVAFCTGGPESVTPKVIIGVGRAVVDGAVPEMVPVTGSRGRPAGRGPGAADQVDGAVPPVAGRAPEYGPPASASGSDCVVTFSEPTTEIDSCTVVDSGGELPSVTCMVNGKLPVSVGLPENTPFASTLRPGGSVPVA